MEHSSRRVVHFGVTQHPTQQWVTQQLKEATPFDHKPKYLLRDRDSRFGQQFDEIPRFRASQLFKQLESLKTATLREQPGGFDQRNLIGGPDEISERIRAYARVGVTTLSGMLFVANSVSEMQEAIELFGQDVLPNFR